MISNKPKWATSGKFVLRLPKPLHSILKQKAAESEKSLNEFCVDALSESIKTDQSSKRILGPWSADEEGLIKNFVEPRLSKLVGILLFGSGARGEETEESDIDLLFVFKNEVEISRDLYREWDNIFKKNPHTKLSPHFAHLPASPEDAGSLWLEVALDGRLLLDRGVRGPLQKIRDYALWSGHLKRRVAHGHYYWVREK